MRSHVLTDWVSQCVERNEVRAATDGWEARQFLHADDLAAFLGAFRRPAAFKRLPLTVDISSGVWTSLRALAELVTAEAARRPHLRVVHAPSSTPSEAKGSDDVHVTPLPSSPACLVLFADKKAVVRTKLLPRLTLPIHFEWQREISLERGIELMFEYYEAAAQQPQQQQP